MYKNYKKLYIKYKIHNLTKKKKKDIKETDNEKHFAITSQNLLF